VESLIIESFFPADPATADYLHGLDSDQRLRAIAQRYPQGCNTSGPLTRADSRVAESA
jgi:hypothetical protein